MNKELIKMFLTMIISFVFLYASFSFCLLEINCLAWVEGARAFFMILYAICFTMSFYLVYIRYRDLKKMNKIKNLILAEYEKGNIVFTTIEGLMTTKLDDFLKQPVEGILYDLNRSEEVILTYLKNEKWVNDYAAVKVIRELKKRLDEK